MIKRFKYLPCLLLICGCSKFLEQEPYNRISIDDIFKDFEGARTTMIGAYDNLKNVDYYQRAIGLFPDLTGGNLKYSRSASQAYLATYFFANTPIVDQNDMRNFYLLAYNTIYRANNIFAYINTIEDANNNQRNRLLAEAYTFRALAHFDLVKVFAQPYNFTANGSHPGIIIRTKNTSADEEVGEVATVKQVYDQINSDLDSAIIRYNASSNIYAGGVAKSYFSADFAKALQCRVALYSEDWNKVNSLATELINGGQYPLTSTNNYVGGWRRLGNRAIDNEAIFFLNARVDISQGAFGDNFNPANNIFGYFAASEDLLTVFAPGDIRGRSSMFVQATLQGQPYFFTRKYQGANDSSDHQKLARISEFYLARAEALAESNNLTAALVDLNRIRQRANPATPALVIENKQVLLDSIFVERRRELCFEGHLFWDITRKKKNLVRNDCVGSNCSINYPSALFAVPRPTQR